MLDKIIKLLSFVFLVLGIWFISKDIETVGAEKLWHMITSTPLSILTAVLLATGINYLFLIGYDVISLEYIDRFIPYPKIIQTALVGFGISNTAGHAYASGGAIRYLFYVPQGLKRLEVLKVIAFETLSIFIGIMVAFEIAVLLSFFELSKSAYTKLNEVHFIGIILLILLLSYYYFIVIPKRNLKIGKQVIQAPDKKTTLKQIFVGFGDNITLFITFYTVFSYYIDASFLETFTVFIIAQSIALATQVPGGIGVFESSFLLLFPHEQSEKTGILASLAVFRVVYYFIPFIVAGIYLGLYRLKKIKSPSLT